MTCGHTETSVAATWTLIMASHSNSGLFAMCVSTQYKQGTVCAYKYLTGQLRLPSGQEMLIKKFHTRYLPGALFTLALYKDFSAV